MLPHWVEAPSHKGTSLRIGRSISLLLHSERFVTKDPGLLNYFLGIEVTYSPNGLFFFCPKSMLLSCSSRLGWQIANLVHLLLCQAGMCEENGPFEDVQLYRMLVGSLQYLTHTRPEISYPVNVVCQYMHAPTHANSSSVKQILRYVKGTIYQGLHFVQSSSQLHAFADGNWAGYPIIRRSTTGFAIFYALI